MQNGRSSDEVDVQKVSMGRPAQGNRAGFSLLELIIVMAIAIVVAGMAIPKITGIVQNFRTGGDARNLNGDILLAKMRASSDFGQARLHVDMNTSTFWVEVEPSGSASWTTEGGVQNLSRNVTFGYGSLTTAPSGTQTTFGQATACPNFSNSACITFNSRGIPVDSTNSPYGNYAIYVSDGKSVSGVTVSITGLTTIWRTDMGAANWIKR
jgi:prepilin-type N-terminal cleavage/methylation domain-containing protein